MVVALAALAVVSTSGCDTKAGIAAVANGHKITESELNKYLTPKATKIPDPATGTPARTFVLNLLIFNAVMPDFLAHTKGGAVSQDALQAATLEALNGDTEANLTAAITKLGLKASFEPVYLQFSRLRTILNSRIESQEDFDAALKTATVDVSVSPRYGSFDRSTLTLGEMSKAQLPDNVKLGVTLPGDAVPSLAPTGP